MDLGGLWIKVDLHLQVGKVHGLVAIEVKSLTATALLTLTNSDSLAQKAAV